MCPVTLLKEFFVSLQGCLIHIKPAAKGAWVVHVSAAAMLAKGNGAEKVCVGFL